MFFLSSFVLCIAQGLIQAFLFTDDSNAFTLMSQILKDGQVPQSNLPWLTKVQDGYKLQLCDHVPEKWDNGTECVTIFENSSDQFSNTTIPAGFRRSVRAIPVDVTSCRSVV